MFMFNVASVPMGMMFGEFPVPDGLKPNPFTIEAVEENWKILVPTLFWKSRKSAV